MRQSFFLGFFYLRYYIDFYIFALLFGDYLNHLSLRVAPGFHHENKSIEKLTKKQSYDEIYHVVLVYEFDWLYEAWFLPNHGYQHHIAPFFVESFLLGTPFSVTSSLFHVFTYLVKYMIVSIYRTSSTHHIHYLSVSVLILHSFSFQDILSLFFQMEHIGWYN